VVGRDDPRADRSSADVDPRWSADEIALVVARGLQQRARQDDEEQAVYGFDHLDELGLHPLLASILADEGWGVWTEQRYPGDRVKTKRSEGRRCDLVLTRAGRPLMSDATAGTLFEGVDEVPPERAYWLEVKTVAQFEEGQAFRRYAAELRGTVTEDIRKIWSDPVIRHGGLLLVLFTADAATAAHDLNEWHEGCRDRGMPVSRPDVVAFPITNRTGNACCTVACAGVRGR
jgi:hypothetical protein